MGEIADGLISGEFDYITGEYLGNPVGYPRTQTYGGRKSKKQLIKNMWLSRVCVKIRVSTIAVEAN